LILDSYQQSGYPFISTITIGVFRRSVEVKPNADTFHRFLFTVFDIDNLDLFLMQNLAGLIIFVFAM